jgi:hypothetical protein
MTLSEYRDVVRRRIDDNDTLVSDEYSDAEINFAINWARNELNKRIRVYHKQYFIYPEQYIDEYDLPTDFLQALDIVDADELVKIFSSELPRTMLLNDALTTLYFNEFFIDDTRQKLCFLELPESDKIEPTYTIGTHTNASEPNDTFTVTATDSGNDLDVDIADWKDMKGYGKMMWSVTLDCDLTEDDATVTLNAGETDTTALLNSNVGCTISGTGVPDGTTLLSITDAGEFEMSANATANGSDITLTFTVPDEQVGFSAIVDTPGDGSYFTIYIPREDLYYTGNNYNYSGGTFKFATYVMFYIGITPDLSSDSDSDRLPRDIGGLIPILAAHYLYKSTSDQQGASFEMQEYLMELNNILHKLKREKSRYANTARGRHRYLDEAYYNKKHI